MRYKNYILRSFNVLNVGLAVVTAFLAWGVVVPAFHSKVTYKLPLVPAKKTAQEKVEVGGTVAPPPVDYNIIAENNLFHPTRAIPLTKVEKPEDVLPKPEFVLYGTLITPYLKVAYMEDKKAPVSTPGRGQRQSSLKQGEVLSGFSVKEIDADKVLMVRGEEMISVPLNSPKAREFSAVLGARPPQNQAAAAPAPVGGQRPAMPSGAPVAPALVGGQRPAMASGQEPAPAKSSASQDNSTYRVRSRHLRVAD